MTADATATAGSREELRTPRSRAVRRPAAGGAAAARGGVHAFFGDDLLASLATP